MDRIVADRILFQRGDNTVVATHHLGAESGCQVSLPLGGTPDDDEVFCVGGCAGVCTLKKKSYENGDVEYWCECL